MIKNYLPFLYMRRVLGVLLTVVCSLAASAGDIHVATTGNDANDGSEGAPLQTIHKAVELVKAGDRILIHEGTYYITQRIKIPELPTNPDLRCEMRAWPEDAVGKVIIDGSKMNPATENEFKMARCIYVNHLANYWTFYGLVLQNAKDNGMKLEGSYNIIERCTFRYNNDTGLQIGMFKDFAIEETKSFPISGTPQFNPGYTYCRYNKIINCDSYENADLEAYGGKSDDGGDADGFACKLFPGPGTEFHGCRAWNNSDDNWDLYMVYHPVVIDHCWSYHAGYYTDKATGKEIEGKNGNGFKLGGGGSAGGAAFDQSTGAHVVTNCVSFENLHKGFDQNNAYEGMYIFNCVAWGNEYNYRFPTIFKYGGMTIRNCVGWGATAQKSGVAVGNHEFLSPDKEGYQDPDTDFNSWTTIDGCNPIKEGYKEGKTQIVTKDHSGEFLSLSKEDFMAEREADGSLPNNNFARLKEGSIFKDMGTPIIGYTPTRKMTEAECTAAGLEYITADDVYIPYNDDAPDFGAFELDGTPFDFVVPDKIEVKCKTANSSQEVIEGRPIVDIVYELNDVATNAVVTGLAEGLSYAYDPTTKTVTISGTPQIGCTFTLTVTGNEEEGVKPYTTTGIITLVTPFKVLTGDWYHFQDAWEDLPADLKGVLEQIAGSSNTTSYSPDKTESDGTVPGGCTVGGFDIGKNNGGIRWNLENGVLQLKVNLHFTGDRQYKIAWTLADGSTGSKTTDKMKKQTLLAWDLIEVAGLTEEKAKQIRTIELLNTSSGGGARIYDMYVRVPDTSATGIQNIKNNANVEGRTMKVLENGRLIIVKNGERFNIAGQKM
ncbi:MAG: right-handed parallel beta-helix repeat-containing protein [Prevotella sp.]|nr:right-handed parallel beta-helix repeat-containing protein [Prevotella sp.]